MWGKFRYKNSILLLFVLSLISCSTLYQKRHSDECRATFEFIKQNWRYDSAIKMYTWGRPMLDFDSYIWENFKTECLSGLSEKEIEKIMGKPTMRISNKKRWIYDYGPSGIKKKQFYYILDFDTINRKLKNIQSAGSRVELHYESK